MEKMVRCERVIHSLRGRAQPMVFLMLMHSSTLVEVAARAAQRCDGFTHRGAEENMKQTISEYASNFKQIVLQDRKPRGFLKRVALL